MREIDRFSDLPDSLIQHVLSFLPTTRDTIRTSVLSKRWRNQWRHVPFLSFHTNLEHIGKVLKQYKGSKLEKFCISTDYTPFQKYPPLNRKTIRFTLDRDVKELILQFHHLSSSQDSFCLPKFLFRYASLVRLKTCFCTFQPTKKVNWMHLKEFRANQCVFPDRAIENIVSGCPLLESLGLKYSDFNRLVIASKTLRKLALAGISISYFGISCPNLEEFRLSGLTYTRPLVDESSVMCDTVRLTCSNGEFVVTSDCLKKLVFNDLKINHLEIACPLLEELELLHIKYITGAKVRNTPSLISATLNLDTTSQVKEILPQLQHAKELTLRRQFILTLFNSKGTIPTLLLSNKYLILDDPNCDGIALALRSFYTLEKLVVKLPIRDDFIEENYWSSNANLLNLSTSELRIVEIHGLKESDVYCKVALSFVEFLLENAKMLEKLTVTLEDCRADFMSDFTRKILSLKWLSQHATVELLHKHKQGWIKEVVSRDRLYSTLYFNQRNLR